MQLAIKKRFNQTSEFPSYHEANISKSHYDTHNATIAYEV